MRPQAQGFDDSLELAGSLYLPEDNPDVVNYKVLDEGIEKMVWATAQYRARFNGNEFQPDGYLTDYYTREAVKVIEANKNRPFFLYLAHWGIHNPIQATKADYDSLSHIKDHGLRVYSAMIKSLDRSVGTIVETLEANGLSDTWRQASTQNIKIPMQGEIDSMNVSVAAGILICEVKRQRDFK